MRLLAQILIGLFPLTACMSGAPPVPTATPDVARWSEREAIAVVQTWLSRSSGDGSCLQSINVILDLSGKKWTAKYLGRGEWLVSVSGQVGVGWRVFEQTVSVSPDHDGESILVLMGC